MIKNTTLERYLRDLWRNIILFIIVTILIVSFMFYQSFSASRQNSLIETNLQIQENFRDLAAHSLDTVRYSAFNSFYTNDIHALINSHNISPTQATRYIRQLNTLTSTNPYIYSVVVLNTNNNMIYTTDRGSLNYDQFEDKQIFGKNNKFLNLRLIENNRWVYSLQFNDLKKNMASMVVNIDADSFNQSLFEKSNDNEYIVVPGENIVFKSNPNSTLPVELTNRSLDSIGYLDIDDTLFFYSYEPQYDLTFIREIPRNQLKTDFSSTLPFILRILALISLVGLVLAWLTRTYYQKPLLNILNSFEVENQKKQSMTNTLNVWIEDQKSKINRAHKQEVQEYFNNILNNLKITAIPNNLLLDINKPIYITLTPFKKAKSLLKFYEGQVESFNIDQFFIIISNSLKEKELEQYAHLEKTTLFISRPKTLDTLYQSFQKLVELYKLRILTPQKYLFHEDDYPTFETDFLKIEELESQLITMLQQAQPIDELFTQWFEEAKSLRSSSLVFYYTKLYSSLRNYIRDLESINSVPTYQFENQLRSTNNIESINRTLLYLMKQYIDYLNKEKESKNELLIQKTKQYIKNHLNSTTLNPEQVSQEVGYNSTYLSRLFKQYTKQSISDYINKQRVNLAKHLLETTDLPANEISIRIGLENTNYFYTFFKKHTNLTPNQYRKQQPN